MNLESLAHELLLTVLSFLRSDHVIYAFHGLNSRFYSLLLNHFAIYGIDFQSLHYSDYFTICKEYLPKLVHKIPSLYLSESSGCSPAFLELCADGFTLDRFIQLKSLSLSGLSQKQLTEKITLALPYLINLTHLTLSHCSLMDGASVDSSILLALINAIWTRPKLTHVNFYYTYLELWNRTIFIEPTVISSSITHLYISLLSDGSFDFTHVYECTPNLLHFCIGFHTFCPRVFLKSPALSITSLDLLLRECLFDLVEMFKFVPNLRRLKIEMNNFILGSDWEFIIPNFLPNLKIFQLHICILFEKVETIEEVADKVLDTFRTPFWINEHKWFVACAWESVRKNFFFYTLPYAMDTFVMSDVKIIKSTCPEEMRQQSYDAVHTLYYTETGSCSQQSDVKFHQVNKLHLILPVSDRFWSIVPSFDYLTSCKIEMSDNSGETKKQLELLLSRASHLSSLVFDEFDENWSIEKLPLEVEHTSIKQLDLITSNKTYDEDECMKFSHSPLAMYCEELHIAVKNRSSICYLMKTMKNLRVLYVKYYERFDQWSLLTKTDETQESLTETKLLDWLRQQLVGVRSSIEISGWIRTIVLRLS